MRVHELLALLDWFPDDAVVCLRKSDKLLEISTAEHEANREVTYSVESIKKSKKDKNSSKLEKKSRSVVILSE